MNQSLCPKRILFLDHAPIVGGAEIALLNLIEGLDRSRFLPLIASPPDSALMPKLARAGIESVAAPFGRLNRAGVAMPVNLFRAALVVASIITKNGIPLVHTNTVRTHIVGSLAAVLTRTRVIWTIHDNTFPLALARWLAPIPARVIAVSRWLRDIYAPAGLGRKTTVIPNGIGSAVSSVSDGDLREELRIPSDAPLVLNVGRLVSGKAPHLFVQAGRIVSGKVPNAYFILVGGPDNLEPGQSRPTYLRELEASVGESGLGEHLLRVGQRSDVARFYAAADLLVYCAASPEGLPTVILEAMSHAKPVVGSAIGGAMEIVQEGVSGLLVPPKDVASMAGAMVYLLQDRARAREMGLAGQARLKQVFDLRSQVAKIEQVYDQCLS